MSGWVNVEDRLPDEETECFLAVRSGNNYVTHKKLAEYANGEWVDIDGDVVTGVAWWMKAPVIDRRKEILERLMRCVGNDKCENRDCCYFVTLDELETLLKYCEE